MDDENEDRKVMLRQVPASCMTVIMCVEKEKVRLPVWLYTIWFERYAKEDPALN
jgi:hypothetical protein